MYRAMRHCWMYEVLTMLRERGQDQELIDEAWKTYKETGFYVRAKDVIYDKKRLVRYVGRYVRHPAIAESRIDEYDGKTVLFHWTDDHDQVQYTRMTVEEFISAVIGHIPERNFKVVRHYGAYARNQRKKFAKLRGLSGIQQQKLDIYVPRKAPKCPICDTTMELIWFHPAEPPPNHVIGERIVDWC